MTILWALVPIGISLCCIFSVYYSCCRGTESKKNSAPLHRSISKKHVASQPEQSNFMERVESSGTADVGNETNDTAESGNCQVPYPLRPPVTQSESYQPSAPPESSYYDTPIISPPPYPVSSNSGYLPYPLSNTNDSSVATDLFSPPNSSLAYHTPAYPATTTETNFPSYPPRP